jgi:hypothetical protein
MRSIVMKSEKELMKEHQIKVVFDFDGVICRSGSVDYSKAEPFQHAIDNINKCYDAGMIVVICTARYMLRLHNDELLASRYGYNEARDWLKKHGVKFHELRFGKASADLYVDDRACLVESDKGEADWNKNFWPAIERIRKEKDKS